MRVFMLTLFAGLTLAVPQGYNYQIEVGSSGNTLQAIPNEFQLLQQQQQQEEQQQPQNYYQEQYPELQHLTQSLIQGQTGGDFQFDNQFLHNAQQQVYQYEQLLKQAQQQETQIPSLEEQSSPIEIKAVIEPPKYEPKTEILKESRPQFIIQPTAPNKYQPKTEILKDSHPQFIIQPTAPSKVPETYQKPKQEEQKVSFQKEFFYLSAPQEEYEPPKDLDKQLASLKKNLKVVFIKAPENNGLEKAALQLAQQSANAQTAIYVLTKQHNAADLAQKLESIKSATPQQPEVAFIKYRTQEEAEHAQRIIQAQYEALDGPNHINRPDTGVTHDFVGSATDHSNDGKARKPLVDEHKIESVKPVSKYLPAAVKK